jgi:hypothetical protein
VDQPPGGPTADRRGVANLTAINTATPMARWPDSGSTSSSHPVVGWPGTHGGRPYTEHLGLVGGLGCPVLSPELGRRTQVLAYGRVKFRSPGIMPNGQLHSEGFGDAPAESVTRRSRSQDDLWTQEHPRLRCVRSLQSPRGSPEVLSRANSGKGARWGVEAIPGSFSA